MMVGPTDQDLEWRHLSRNASLQSHRLIGWIDVTAGPNWMPAARDRVPRR